MLLTSEPTTSSTASTAMPSETSSQSTGPSAGYSPGMSLGAKIGVGVGCGTVGLVASGIAIFFLRTPRRKAQLGSSSEKVVTVSQTLTTVPS